MKRGKVIVVVAILSVLTAAGCKDRRTYQTTTTQVSSSNYLLNAKDFDLATVVGLIKANKVDSAQALEKTINTTGGINNVDIDKDGKIDYLLVKETRADGAIALNILAVPSSTKKAEEATVIASVSFKKNTVTNQVEVTGGYPNYVDGYAHHHYHYTHSGLSFGQAMFLAWMFSPRPIYYYPHVRPYYVPRSVYVGSRLSNVRSSYRTRTRVSPVRRVTRPSNYSIRSARKVPSRFSRNLRRGTGFSGRSGASRSYGVRSRTRPRSSGSAFRRRSTTRSAPRSTPRSRSWSSPSRSRSRSWGGSRSRSRSWGSPSRSRSRSWGGGSRSRSWGGSRSRSFGGSRRRSDASFKKNIIPVDGALERVSKLRGVYFRWKDGAPGRQVGVIAQDVKKVLPEAVSHDGRGYMVDYSAMIPLLIEAVKELRDQQSLCR